MCFRNLFLLEFGFQINAPQDTTIKTLSILFLYNLNIFLFSKICLECQEGQFKNPFSNECLSCPLTGGYCKSGLLYNQEGLFVFLLDKNLVLGYWKENENSTKLYACLPYATSCLRSEPHNFTHCQDGFVGPLCQSCKIGYAKYDGVKCGACYSYKENIIMIALVTFGLFLFLIFYIRLAYLIIN